MSYAIIPMPVDKDGKGPANEQDTVRTVYQIWDECFETVDEFHDYEDAIKALAALEGGGY